MNTSFPPPRPPSRSSSRSSSFAGWLRLAPPDDGSPWWRYTVWTLTCVVLVALGFTVLNFVTGAHTLADWLSPWQWGRVFGQCLVVSLMIGLAIHALFSLAYKLFGRERIRALGAGGRRAFYIALPLLGTAIGWPIGVSLITGDLHVVTGMGAADILGVVVMSLAISGLFFVFISLRVRQIKADMRANEARLRLLQGQMEPHFLFNTLANIISLIDADAPRAKHVLEAFTDYLRASLGSLRRTDSTLGAELDLAERFLVLMQARMGDRLRFELVADPALRGAALPPQLLQPLVENAVKHGLEPQVDGGTVRVHAMRVLANGRDALQVCVDDDGIGLAAAATRRRRPVAGGPDGNGVALANLHERLQVQFGTQASFVLADRDAATGSGTRACLLVPWAESTPTPGTPATPRRA